MTLALHVEKESEAFTTIYVYPHDVAMPSMQSIYTSVLTQIRPQMQI